VTNSSPTTPVQTDSVTTDTDAPTTPSATERTTTTTRSQSTTETSDEDYVEALKSISIRVGTVDSPVEINRVSLPDNHIVISSDGDLGFDLPIEITAEQLEIAGLDPNNVNFYYIDSAGTIAEISEAAEVNEDGSMTVTVNSFSDYVLAETAPVNIEDDQPNSNIWLIIALIVAVLIIGGLIVVIVRLKRNQPAS
jgi:hypothetical protein